MSKRLIAGPLLLAMVAAMFAMATAAEAETCVSLPGTTGATIEAAGERIRVPATSGVAACVEPGGLPGLPRVDTAGGTVSIVLGAGSGTSGYVAVRYALDGAPNEIRVPIPGLGSGSETCLASVGEIVRPDCLVKVTIDDIPPVPTAPPIPTRPPVPTLPPIEPIDPFCNHIYCIAAPPDLFCNDLYCINENIPPICLSKPNICVT